jgi:hypothetical protein
MKSAARQLLVSLLVCMPMFAQAGQNSGQSGQPTPPAPSQQQEDRPTLGPRNSPGEVTGPDTSSTTDIRKLMAIRTLYIESIDNSLSDKLIETIGKLGRFRLVTTAKDADATLRGSCLESRRLKRVHSEVFISDRKGGSIWQDEIFRPFNPPALDKAVTDTATLVGQHLAMSIRDADRRQ